MLPTFDLIDVVKLSYIKMDKGHKYVSAIHSEDCLRLIKICFYNKENNHHDDYKNSASIYY